MISRRAGSHDDARAGWLEDRLQAGSEAENRRPEVIPCVRGRARPRARRPTRQRPPHPPERMLWPYVGFTKADLAHYYNAIAHAALPHVINRPLSLFRCPEGMPA